MPVMLLGGSPPGLEPTAFAGLQLWFDAGVQVYTDTAGTTPAADGNTVRSWKDRQSNYLIPDNGAGTGPTLDIDLVNGRPALVFDGTNDRFVGTANDADSFLAVDAFTMFAVVRHAAATPPQQYYMTFYDGVNHVTNIGNTASVATYRVENYDGTLDVIPKAKTLTNWGIMTAMHSGGNIYCGADDTRDASLASTASGNTSFGANTNLLIRDAPATFAAMDIAELIMYNVALSETNRQEVERRLAWKYGITLPY
jgi:hypothetical protein